MDSGADQQARCAMAKIMEPHAWQPRALQECLEVLREPRPVDGVATWGDEDESVVDANVRPLGAQTVALRAQPFHHE